MMKNRFKKFIETMRTIKLSPDEKSLSLSKIKEFISFNPIRGEVPIPRERNYLSIFEVGYFMKATALVLIITIVAGGAGVSYAASNALPGDKLYNIKVNVNEKIEDGLAFTPEAKITVQSKKVERRLEEAQVLAKEKRLSTDNKKIVENKLDEHLEQLTKEIKILKEGGNVGMVLETTSKLTPILEAHKDVFEGKDEDTDTLVAKVTTTIETVTAEENAILAVVTDSKDSDTESSDVMMMSVAIETPEEKFAKVAQDEIDEMNDEIESIVEARIKAARAKIREIKNKLPAEEAQETVEEPVISDIKVETDTEVKADITAPILKTDEAIKTEVEVKEEMDEVAPSIEIETDLTTKIKEEFNVRVKIKEAESLLREAEDSFEKGKWKDALSLAQRVNHLAYEIEIHNKLKELELAQKAKIENTQKATAIKAI